MSPDPFDPEHFRRRCRAPEPEPVRPTTRKSLPRPKERERYLGGPIPLSWLSRAASLPGKALHLAVALWYAAVRTPDKNPEVKLTRTLAAEFGLSARTTRARAIEALAGASLVAVSKRAGRSVVLTILPAPPTSARRAASG